jgi:hypothetical protein
LIDSIANAIIKLEIKRTVGFPKMSQSLNNDRDVLETIFISIYHEVNIKVVVGFSYIKDKINVVIFKRGRFFLIILIMIDNI